MDRRGIAGGLRRHRQHHRRQRGSAAVSSAAAAAAGIARVEALEQRCFLTAVTTYHNDNASTGVNNTETLLTPATVNFNTFGKQFSTPVDGQVYGQPLYVPGLNITGGPLPGIHNTVLVTTQHDSVYAIDSTGGNVLWQISLIDKTNPKVNLIGASSITTVPSGDTLSTDITPEVGITSTPVIDLPNHLMYVESKSKQIVNGNVNAPHYVHTLYKIDIAAGTIVSSTIIGDTIYSGGNYTYRTTNTGTGTDPYVVGSGDGAINVGGQNRVYFNALREMDRPGVQLWNGHLLLSFASHGDNGPYHGWVLMYDPATLTLQGALNTTPNGGLGGIWQAGGILAADSAGYLYFETGNGTFDGNNGTNNAGPVTGLDANGFPVNGDYGDSFIKITLDPTTSQGQQGTNKNGWGLKVVDYFAPFNNHALDSADADLGSGGDVVLPDSAGNATHQHLLIGAGKEGKLYLIDRDNMGHYGTTDNVVQTVGSALSGSLNTPAYFNGRLYYFPGYSGQGKSWQLTNANINTASGVQTTPDSIGYLDGTPSISANGTTNGIVWVIDRGSNQLRAYNANNIATELWTSAQAPNNRDQLGTVVKFTVPTVADGQVFVGTADHLVVYGPPTPPTSPPADPTNLTINPVAFNNVVLNWIDHANNEDSFSIERSPDNSTWTQVGMVSSNVTTFTDTTTLATTQYYYRVRAHNTFNGNSYSNYVTGGPITTPAAPVSGNGDGLVANYYDDNYHLVGTPALTRNDATIDFDWGTGSPGTGIGVDHFSVRWTGTVKPTTTETYTFSTTSDDGVRLWVNNQLIIDNWTDHSPTVNTATMNLTANTSYAIRMEYYENGGGAVAKLHWSTSTIADVAVPFIGGSATGQYFNDPPLTHLSGTPVITRVEPNVTSAGWVNGSPGAPLGNTYFSAKWTGEVQAQYSQTYTFHTTSDEGVRLFVNGVTVIDDWTTGHTSTDDFGTIALSAGQKYNIELDYYQITGPDVIKLNWSSPSTPDQLIPTSQLYSGVAPAAPSGLAVNAASGTELDLTWQDNSNIETGYSVERSTDGVNYTPITPSLPANTTSFNDTALNPNTLYYYRVRALNFGQNSPYSNIVSMTTPVPPNKPTNAHPTKITAAEIDFAWNDTSNNEDGFRISRSANNGTFIVIAQLPPNSTTYNDTGLTPGNHYEYHIQAYNVAGYNDFTGFNADTLPPAPLNLHASGRNQQIAVSWNSANGADTYNVYRSTTSGGEGTTPYATGITDTTFYDNAVTNGVTYYYKVSAVNGSGEGSKFLETNATPSAGSVAGRYVYYAGSVYDSLLAGPGLSNHETAVDHTKSALLPGQAATSANVTGFYHGINGIAIDVSGLAVGVTPVAGDFAFAVGTGNDPSKWSPGPAPASISVIPGGGTGGSDRIAIDWGDNSIQNEWLQVTMKPGLDTGIVGPDVFYFGNLIGDTGNDTGAGVMVSATDLAAVRSASLAPITVSTGADVNKDGLADATDSSIIRSNTTHSLLFFNAPAPAPAAVGAAAPASAAGTPMRVTTGTTTTSTGTTTTTTTVSPPVPQAPPTPAGKSATKPRPRPAAPFSTLRVPPAGVSFIGSPFARMASWLSSRHGDLFS